ncbi:dihydrofolate reductase-like domain-containing protein [Chaetomidium leptoderma]|uniref:Dihydrofolate reductase n=1 Tax=Chaetomidium leptoderma TaxID=669021 RepID=A0AAN6ZZQ1_9PEZI|nr:dihydrofolate reductase-like domain-containing protein [Chaetomidium leptoderma]
MPTTTPATAAAAAAAAALPELTLIVAATQQMGIGRNGTLPWTGLRREMAYFARVTKRLLPPPSPSPSSGGTSSGSVVQQQNAVVMGRKTWESIPQRFRPLAGRVNVVVSRSMLSSVPSSSSSSSSVVIVARSMEEALLKVQQQQQQQEGAGGRVFVIGGAQIYRAALEVKEARRVLLTRVRSGFECDTFFPLKLVEGAEDGAEEGWRRMGQEEMDAWVGEEVPRGVQVENGTEYEFEMWEKV